MAKLWRRSGEPLWLERGRALAMHGWGRLSGIGRTMDKATTHGGLATRALTCLLRNCISGSDASPTLYVF